jgi:carbonic anhydrase
MESFLQNLQYTTLPVQSSMIPWTPTQRERILWIGCSDSPVDETDVLNVPRREMFVYRNLGNNLANGDVSSLSAIEFFLQDVEVG